MRHRALWSSAFVVFAAAAVGRAQAGSPAATPAPPSTIASIVNGQIDRIEKLVVDAAEAMPEEKYGFSPEGLAIPGSDYKGVRTFGQQVRHIAASNYAIWWALTGDEVPSDFKGGNGPDTLKTKAEILKFLKDSYALGHRAARLKERAANGANGQVGAIAPSQLPSAPHRT